MSQDDSNAVRNKHETIAQRQRMKEYTKRFKIDRDALAMALKTTRGYVDQVLSGKNGFSAGLREKLSKYYPNLNVDWLMTGEGDMLVDENPIKKELKFPEPGTLDPMVMEPLYPYSPDAGKPAGVVEQLAARVAALEALVAKMALELNGLRGCGKGDDDPPGGAM